MGREMRRIDSAPSAIYSPATGMISGVEATTQFREEIIMRQFANIDDSEQSQEVRICAVTVKRETTKAYLILAPDNSEIWLPKSQVNQQINLDGAIDFVIPRWLYEEKDMEGHGL